MPLDPAAVAADGAVDLAAHHPGPDDHLVYYAWIDLTASVRTEAVLHLGSDDTLSVWLDGRPIHAQGEYRAAAPDQDRVPVVLERGDHSLLLKVCNGEGGFAFYFELKDPGGRAPLRVTFPMRVTASGPPRR